MHQHRQITITSVFCQILITAIIMYYNILLEFGFSLTRPYKPGLQGEGCFLLIKLFSGCHASNVGLLTHSLHALDLTYGPWPSSRRPDSWWPSGPWIGSDTILEFEFGLTPSYKTSS